MAGSVIQITNFSSRNEVPKPNHDSAAIRRHDAFGNRALDQGRARGEYFDRLARKGEQPASEDPQALRQRSSATPTRSRARPCRRSAPRWSREQRRKSEAVSDGALDRDQSGAQAGAVSPTERRCPLLGAERTPRRKAATSVFDPSAVARRAIRLHCSFRSA